MKPEEYPAGFYDFKSYNTKHRMLTYWYQINEILSLKSSPILEIGVGSGLVKSYLDSVGLVIKTLDINQDLNPDYVGSVLNLDECLSHQDLFNVVLCARVLHHLPFDCFQSALDQIANATQEYALITLPVEDFRFYFMFRYTSSTINTYSLPLPLFIKKALFQRKKTKTEERTSSFWKINDDHEHSLSKVRKLFDRRFDIINEYMIPEDSAHYIAVLKKKNKGRIIKNEFD